MPNLIKLRSKKIFVQSKKESSILNHFGIITAALVLFSKVFFQHALVDHFGAARFQNVTASNSLKTCKAAIPPEDNDQ